MTPTFLMLLTFFWLCLKERDKNEPEMLQIYNAAIQTGRLLLFFLITTIPYFLEKLHCHVDVM
jgi:hypothetical protein